MYVCMYIGEEENWVDGLIFRGERLGKGNDECRFGYFKSVFLVILDTWV